MANDLDILIAKFLLCKDFSQIAEDFEKLCELGNLDVLQCYYRVYSIKDNEFIDDMVDKFEELSEPQRVKLEEEAINLDANSKKYQEIESLLNRNCVKLDKIIYGNKAKLDKTKLFIEYIRNYFILINDNTSKKIINNITSVSFNKISQLRLKACAYEMLNDKPSKKVMQYLAMVASQQYSVDISNYKLKRKQEKTNTQKAPLISSNKIGRENNSLFEETLNYWKKFSKKEKIKHLQMYESINAKLHNRDEREVRLDNRQTIIDNKYFMGGTFDKRKPTVLNITLLSNDECDAIFALDATYHEGYHAYFYDFLQDKVDLKTLSNQKRVEDFINKYKMNVLTCALLLNNNPRKSKKIENWFLDASTEEMLVYKESAIYAIYNLLKMANSQTNLSFSFDNYIFIITSYFHHIKRIKKVPFTKTEFLKVQKDIQDLQCYMDTFVKDIDLPKKSQLKPMTTMVEGNSRLIELAITEPIISLTKKQLDIIIKLMDRSLIQLARGDIVQMQKDFERVSALIK